MSEYADKLRNPKWQKCRLRRLELSDWKCDICGDKNEELQVHHLLYPAPPYEPWDVSPKNLMALCATCHSLMRIDLDKIGTFYRFKSGAKLEDLKLLERKIEDKMMVLANWRSVAHKVQREQELMSEFYQI